VSSVRYRVDPCQSEWKKRSVAPLRWAKPGVKVRGLTVRSSKRPKLLTLPDSLIFSPSAAYWALR
jgi:hypothetical protein